nr:MAG TPA: hypothetical protein [Caudoviricetes sp.]
MCFGIFTYEVIQHFNYIRLSAKNQEKVRFDRKNCQTALFLLYYL